MATDGQNDPPEEVVNETETSVTPPVVKPPEESHTDVKGLIDGLSDRVTGLEATVQALIPSERDSTPGRRPWTHKRMFGGN
jgi:hypothetical protein